MKNKNFLLPSAIRTFATFPDDKGDSNPLRALLGNIQTLRSSPIRIAMDPFFLANPHKNKLPSLVE